jgi:ligand-binding sensor domain-containing protein
MPGQVDSFPQPLSPLPDVNVHGMHEDRAGTFWVATEKVHQLAEAEHSTRDPEKESP